MDLSQSDNPLGTDGFEFVEFAAPDCRELELLLETLGFIRAARHRSKDVSLYRQNGINFIVNAEASGFARQFALEHGPSACAMAFRVRDSAHALRCALAAGARQIRGIAGPMELNLPAIEGIGGSLIYLIDRYGDGSRYGNGSRSGNETIYEIDFVFDELGPAAAPFGAGLLEIDHLTHNVRSGRMQHIHDFYQRVFNFREQQYFDISGEYTGLTSRALAAPCGKIRIPINEPKPADGEGRVDQIQEFIDQYRGEGIQHVALRTDDIFRSWDELRARGLEFMAPPPDSYYEMLEERLPGHGQPLDELHRRGILLDGADGRFLAQIFTDTVIGPIFFELIQRNGDDGFGHGNFRALFLSMERDQIRRGVLKPTRP